MSDWYNCNHEWEEVDGISGRDVKCIKCQCPGEIDNEETGEVFWPTT